jgi:siroheme synthase
MRDDRPSLDLPNIEPGQIWLIEHDPGEPFCRFDGAVLGQANVVLYDRALAPLVAQALPIGAYAEPLPGAAPAAGPAIAPRALDFAAEGWIVVQLVAASPAWRVRLPIAPPALSQARRDGALPVRVITKAAGDRHHEVEASLGDLAELVREAGADERLSIVFGPFLAHYPSQARAFTANGLAG